MRSSTVFEIYFCHLFTGSTSALWASKTCPSGCSILLRISNGKMIATQEISYFQLNMLDGQFALPYELLTRNG
jgi:hypothetical protein